MRKLCIRIIFICFLILNQNVLFAAEDEGYFLSLKQKGQLISLGQIQDNEGVWYDIWISPGYVSPYRYSKKYFYETGSAFAEYFHAQKYIDLAELSKKSYRFAFDGCINKCIIKGIPIAWEDNFESASKRTEKRVFGWWFSYPWAFMESTVDNVVRIPLCLTGSVLSIGVGTVVSPVYYMTNSSVKGIWYLSVNTITLPVIAGTWNTIISPPLSLIGQKPSLERVDGFWVKALTNEQALNLEYSESPISRNDIVLLQQWGVILDTELKPYKDEQIKLRNETEAARKKIMDYQNERELKIRGDESQHVNNLRTDPDTQQLLTSLSERGFTANRLRVLKRDIKKTLKESKNANDEEINHLINLLIQYPPSLINEKDYRSKTDPFRRSVDVMKDVNVPNE